VLTLVIAAVPPAPMLWQLTMARKSGIGLVPCSAGGAPGLRTARIRRRAGARATVVRFGDGRTSQAGLADRIRLALRARER